MARARRRKLTFIDLWYAAEGPDDPVERFVEQCRPIYTLYTYGLRECPTKIAATASWMRISPTSPTTPYEPWPGVDRVDDEIELPEEPPDNFGFSESPHVRIDQSLIGLPPADRGAAYLAWLHSVLLRVARFRGWSEDPLRYAYQYCLHRNCQLHMESPRRRSPDRQHTAVLAWDVEPDGWTRLTIDVRDRQDAVVRSQSTLLQAFYPDVNDWPSLRRSFGWTSDRVVEAPTLFFDMRLSLDDPTLESAEPEAPVDHRPRTWRPEPTADEIEQLLGGDFPELGDEPSPYRFYLDLVDPSSNGLQLVGWANGSEYFDLLNHLLRTAESDDGWQRWWASVHSHGSIMINVFPESPSVERKVRIIRGSDDIKITFKRDHPDDSADASAEAAADFDAIMTAVAKRFKLSSPPTRPAIP